MILADALLDNRNSLEQTTIVARWVLLDSARLQELISLFDTDDAKVKIRAAWVLALIGEKKPDVLYPFYATLISGICRHDVEDGVKRNVLRILHGQPLDETLHGEVMNVCFNALENPKEPVAIKSFAMGILGDLSSIYPEIKNELKLLIEAGLEQDPTPGYRSKARKVLQQIK